MTAGGAGSSAGGGAVEGLGGGGVEAGVGVEATGGGGGVAVGRAVGVAGAVSRVGGLVILGRVRGGRVGEFGREFGREGTYSVKVAIRAELEGGGALAVDEEELGGAAAVADSEGGWAGAAVVDEAVDDVAVAGPTGAGSTGGITGGAGATSVGPEEIDVLAVPPGGNMPAGAVEEGDSSSAVQSSSPGQECSCFQE